MPDWDEDSPQLRKNLAQVLDQIVQAAERREIPAVEAARHWHVLVMRGLDVPDPRFVGTFRGEAGLDNVQVIVAANYGVDAAGVADELTRFETKLRALTNELDTLLAAGQEPDADELAAVVDLCAWAHAEWVRIHPFANGSGRIARLWANSLAARYGLPPFIRMRPRPEAGYGDAGEKAMQGDWKPTVAVFRRLLDDFLDEL